MTADELERLCAQLRALADPTRIRILRLVMSGTQCNCEIGDSLDAAPNLISHHLRVLREAGLLHSERDAEDSRWVYYSLRTQATTALIGELQALFAPEDIKPRSATCGPISKPTRPVGIIPVEQIGTVSQP